MFIFLPRRWKTYIMVQKHTSNIWCLFFCQNDEKHTSLGKTYIKYLVPQDIYEIFDVCFLNCKWTNSQIKSEYSTDSLLQKHTSNIWCLFFYQNDENIDHGAKTYIKYLMFIFLPKRWKHRSWNKNIHQIFDVYFFTKTMKTYIMEQKHTSNI